MINSIHDDLSVTGFILGVFFKVFKVFCAVAAVVSFTAIAVTAFAWGLDDDYAKMKALPRPNYFEWVVNGFCLEGNK